MSTLIRNMVLALAAVVLAGFGANALYQYTRGVQAKQRADAAIAAVVDKQISAQLKLPEGWKVVDFVQANSAYSPLRLILRPDEFDNERNIHISGYVTISELHATDPNPIAPADYKTYASLHAADYGRAECARVMQIIANKCMVSQAGVTQIKGDIFQIQLFLRFTYKDGFGTVPPNVDVQFVSAPVDFLPTKIKPQPSTISAQGSDREAYYRMARDACASLRSSNGNCAISNITLDSWLDQRTTNTTPTNANARFVSLQRVAGAK